MKKKGNPIEKALAFLLGFFFVILLWWVLSIALKANDLHYLPSPSTILSKTWSLLFADDARKTFIALGYSLLKLTIGFVISFLLAAILGTLAAIFPLFEAFERSHVILFRSVPTAGIAMILGTAFWLEIPALQPFIPSILSFLIAFPIFYQAFLDGVSAISREEKDALRLEGAEKKIFTIFNVYWPDSQEFILMSLKQAFGLSLKVTIMSEIVTNSGTVTAMGLGTLIGKSIQEKADLNLAMAYSLIAVLFVLLIDLINLAISKAVHKKINN